MPAQQSRRNQRVGVSPVVRLVGLVCALSAMAVLGGRPVLAQAPPGQPVPPKPRLLVIGDSVLEGTYDKIPAALPEWDVTVDAHLNRNTADALGVIQTRGLAFDAVVVQLGTNDAQSASVYQPRVVALLDALAPVPRVLWLTIHEIRPYYYEANQIIRAEAAAHRNVEVLDWNLAAAPGDTYADGLHLTPQGADAMASFIARALRAPAQPFATTTTSTSTTSTTSTTTTTTTTMPATTEAPRAASAPVGDRPTPPPPTDDGPSGTVIVLLALVVLVMAAVPLLVVWRRRRVVAGPRTTPGASDPYDE